MRSRFKKLLQKKVSPSMNLFFNLFLVLASSFFSIAVYHQAVIWAQEPIEEVEVPFDLVEQLEEEKKQEELDQQDDQDVQEQDNATEQEGENEEGDDVEPEDQEEAQSSLADSISEAIDSQIQQAEQDVQKQEGNDQKGGEGDKAEESKEENQNSENQEKEDEKDKDFQNEERQEDGNKSNKAFDTQGYPLLCHVQPENKENPFKGEVLDLPENARENHLRQHEADYLIENQADRERCEMGESLQEKEREDGDEEGDSQDEDDQDDGDDEDNSEESNAVEIKLKSITLNEDEIIVNYSKQFETCAHLYNRSGKIKQTINFICQAGEDLVAAADMNRFEQRLELGDEVKICHGNNGNLCSEFVTLTEQGKEDGEYEDGQGDEGGVTGSIRICSILADSQGAIAEGFDILGTQFILRGADAPDSYTQPQLIPETVFETPLQLNADLLFGDGQKDAQCTTHSDLPLGDYFYSQGQIGGSWQSSDFEPPVYNDLFQGSINDLNSLFEAGFQLFDDDPANDNQRQAESDGHIPLNESRPERTLVIYNQFLDPLPEDLPAQDVRPIFQGELFPDSSSSDQFVGLEDSTLTLATLNFGGKRSGDPFTHEEVFTVLSGMTTTEEDVEKVALQAMIQQASDVVAQALLEDSELNQSLAEVADKKFLQTLQGKVEEVLARDTVQRQLANALEDDPQLETFLHTLFPKNEKETLLSELVQQSLWQGEALNPKAMVYHSVDQAHDQLALSQRVGEAITENPEAKAILLQAISEPEIIDSGQVTLPSLEFSIQTEQGNIDFGMDELSFESGSLRMNLNRPRQFTPGVYPFTFRMTNPLTGEEHTFTQDFAWGVLALNTDRDVYKPGEQADITVGVLDDQGVPVCDATVTLEVIPPSGSIDNLTVQNTGQCSVFDSTNIIPDYLANYTFSEVGQHTLKLTATHSNQQVRTRTFHVGVANTPSYVIERSAATRLYPVGSSEMTMSLYFSQDFTGDITEVVPASFEILDVAQAGTGLIAPADITFSPSGEEKYITWSISALDQDLFTLAYGYDAPDISPEFYTMGPIFSTGNLVEARAWEIANDEPIIGADDTSDLLGHWKFNAGSGSTAADSTANNNDGTLTNMEAGDWTTDTPGLNNNPFALDFDGSNEYVTIPDPAGGELDFGDTDDFTITGWFNRQSFNNLDTVIAKRNGGNSALVGYRVYLPGNSDRLILEISDGTDEYRVRSNSRFRSGTNPGWNHFAVTWDQDSVAGSEMYINGVVDAVGDAGAAIGDIGDFSNALTLNIGAESDAGGPFNGILDDIRIYGRVLTPEEISVLANGNSPGGVANLQLWLKADEGVTNTGDGTDATTWVDQVNGLIIDQNTTPAIGGTFPTYNENLFNFNPGLSFDAITDRLGNDNFANAPTGDLFIATVYRRDDYADSEEAFISYNTAGTDSFVLEAEADGGVGSEINNNQLSSGDVGATDGLAHIHIMRRTGTTHDVLLDGSSEASETEGATIATGGCVVIGEEQDSECGGFETGQAFEGDLAEFLVYDAYPALADQVKIGSYLAIKYGITLDQSAASGGLEYTDSSGNTIWSQDTSDTFENDIVAIGRDDLSGLSQTSSKAEKTDAILTLSAAASQDDLDFLFASNNDGAATWTDTGAPTGYEILTRQWQAQEINDMGSATLSFDVADAEFDVPTTLDSGDYYFVSDADNDGLLSDETPVAMTDAGGDVWTTTIDFNGAADSKIDFTLASMQLPPPTVTDPNISINTGGGTASTFIVGDEIIVTWNNSATGDNNSGLTSVIADLSGWGGSATETMTDTTACSGTAGDNIYEACFTLVSGSIDATNINASVTATNGTGPTTTADTSNAIVDNQPPNITDNGTLIITTDNSVGGVAAVNDGATNQDKVTQSAVILSVADGDTTTIDLTTLTGEATLAAAAESGVLVAGSLDNASQTFTITVTDNAGNVSATASDAISVDNQPPNITDNGTLIITTDNSVGGVAAVNDGATNQDKVTQSTVTLAVSDGDISTIDLTNLTSEATLALATESAVLIAGSLDNASQTFDITTTDNAGNIATTASDAISVDNQIPVVSVGNISVMGATGTSSAFKNGDIATGRWDDSGAGDNNGDIGSVSFDLSDFRAVDTSVAGSNAGNIWTAAITGTLDSQGDTNNNTSVVVTDDGGNITNLTGTNNYTVDTILPTIDSITSVAGDTTSPYYDPTDDSSTAIIFASSDTGTGMSTCKWDTSNTTYAAMANTCASTTTCTTNLSGDGAKTVYLSCIDGVGNAISANTQVDYTVDSAGPIGTSITPNSTRIIDTSNPSFVVDDGTDAGSGIDTGTRLLERADATYTNNTCGTFGSFSSVAISGTYPNISDATVSGSACYKYRYSVSDNAGNSTTTAETAIIVRVPLTTITITSGDGQSYGGVGQNPIGYTLPTALEVEVNDGGTNTALATEVTVDFAITTVPLSPTATGQSLSAASDDTDANGNAQVSLTFGDRAGVYQVQASSSHASIGNTVTFNATAGSYFEVQITESTLVIALDPVSNATDFASPTVTVSTNAASYDLRITPDQFPLSGVDQILNWVNPLGFGWNLDLGTVTAFVESLGNPDDTTVYSCSGDACQGANGVNVDIYAGIDFTYPPGTYNNDVEFAGVNISY